MEKCPDKVAAYLTHELRSPLQALRFALELLNKDLEDGASEKNKRILDAALLATDRMRSHIDDILEMSRVQMGQTRLERQVCSPGELAMETGRYYEAWAERKWLRLKVVVEEGCPEVTADPRRVVQALTNLLTNAIKYTPAGGTVEIRVRRGRRDEAGFVLFTVRDTGCGIAAEDLPRVFRYFAQGDGEIDGAGLGLPLARSFVELQGGKMWAKSRKGEGTAFYFTLPVHIPAAEPPLSRPAGNSAESTSQRPAPPVS
ncbi:MAG: HAMP domain-containing sensor histidine kinase [Elusimicrobiota bacterium]